MQVLTGSGQVWGRMNDHIHIEKLEVFAHIGVPDEERASPQRLIVNITFSPTCRAEAGR